MCQQMNKIKNILLSFFFLWNQILVCLLQFQNKLTVYTQHITLLPYIWYIAHLIYSTQDKIFITDNGKWRLFYTVWPLIRETNAKIVQIRKSWRRLFYLWMVYTCVIYKKKKKLSNLSDVQNHGFYHLVLQWKQKSKCCFCLFVYLFICLF